MQVGDQAARLVELSNPIFESSTFRICCECIRCLNVSKFDIKHLKIKHLDIPLRLFPSLDTELPKQLYSGQV